MNDTGKIGRCNETVPGWLIPCILLIAFALRILGNGYGLPDQLNVDEAHVVSHAIRFGKGDLNPHFFFYPAGYMYFLFTLFAGYFCYGFVTRVFTSPADFGAQFFIDPTAFYLISRTATAAIGTATVYVAYLFAKRRYGARAGAAAAIFLSLAPLHARLSHFATTDVPMTFFILLSLYFAAAVARDGERKHYLFAGLAAGLGTSMKYTAALVLPSLFLAHALFVIGERRAGKRIKIIGSNPIIMIAAFAIAFIGTSPYTLLDFKTFIGDLKIQNQLVTGGWFGLEKPMNVWVESISNFLLNGLGAPLLVVSLAGAVALTLRRKRTDAVLALFVLVFYLVHSKYTQHNFDRYWVAVVPAFCVFAAALTGDAMEKVFRNGRGALAATVIISVAIMAMPTSRIVSNDLFIRKTTTQTIARRWVESHIPAGTRIATESGGPQLSPDEESLMAARDPQKYKKWRVDAAIPFFAYKDRKPASAELNSEKTFHKKALEKIARKYYVLQPFALAEYKLDFYKEMKFEYIIASSFIYDRYYNAPEKYPEAVGFYDALRDEGTPVKKLTGGKDRPGPDILIYRIKGKR
ncbi:MAG TPA: glycosyltransferase family 39 protein [bacterium]|nr:glycosyltransferase family 39 protein [bacterium]